MNYIVASISKIQSVDSINVVSFTAEGHTLKMMSLELDESLETGAKVSLGVKSTNVSLSKSFNAELSISNQLPSKIVSVESGALLCRVKMRFLDTELESLITKDSALRMNLEKGDEVLALIKSSELSIAEVL